MSVREERLLVRRGLRHELGTVPQSKEHSIVTGACIEATEDFGHQQLGLPGFGSGPAAARVHKQCRGLSDPGRAVGSLRGVLSEGGDE